MRLRLLRLLVGLMASACTIATGDVYAGERWIGTSGGTLGPQVEAGMRFDERWGVRGSVNALAFSFIYHDDEAGVHSRMRLLGVGLTADYYPGEGGFHLSGGARLSADRASGRVTDLVRHMNIFGTKAIVVVPDPLTRFTVTQNAIQPYLGIGYSKKLSEKVSVNLDMGALYTGKPKLDVDSDATRLGFTEEQIEGEIKRARDRLSPYRVYPVVQLGLNFRF